MPWTSIVLLDLQDARVAELVDAFRQEALGAGQTDPLPRTVQLVVDEVRNCIGFCSSTPLEADPATIPAGRMDMGVQNIARTMKARLLQPLT